MRFVKSALDANEFPRHALPEIAFVGRSNVGKSSLINTVANASAASVSARPGCTRSIDFYAVERWFSVVDMPGFGFAYAPEKLIKSWPALVFGYLKGRRNLRHVFLLVDARHGLKAIDKEVAAKLDENDVYFRTVLTKCDLLQPTPLAKRIEEVQEDLKVFRYAAKDVLLSSTKLAALKSEMRKEFLRLNLIPKEAFERRKAVENSNAESHNESVKRQSHGEKKNLHQRKVIPLKRPDRSSDQLSERRLPFSG